MSERKVLNKYYPPDFDPDKVPKLRMQRERQYTVRTMAPFNMRCKTCGDYIYQGKKFNAKTESVLDESYLGLRIYRFYIKCPKCISEISFKTDPENEDYALEHGATRLFEAAKVFRKAEEQEKQDREDEEANNPMKILENRTKDSKLEMEILENLEELRELNTRKVDIDYAAILRRKAEADATMLRKQEEEDEAYVVKLFGKQDGGRIKRLEDKSDDEEGTTSCAFSSKEVKRPSDVLTSDDKPQRKKPRVGESSGSKFSSKSALSGLVKVKNSGLKSTRPKAKTSPSDSAKTEVNKRQESSASVASELWDKTSAVQNTETLSSQPVVTPSGSSERVQNSGCPPSKHEDDQNDHDGNISDSENEKIQLSIQEGLVKREIAQTGAAARPKAKSVGLSLLGGYEVSSDDSDGSSE